MAEMQFIPMPEWWDERGKVTLWHDTIMVAHPEHPPHIWNDSKEAWEELKLS